MIHLHPLILSTSRTSKYQSKMGVITSPELTFFFRELFGACDENLQAAQPMWSHGKVFAARHPFFLLRVFIILQKEGTTIFFSMVFQRLPGLLHCTIAPNKRTKEKTDAGKKREKKIIQRKKKQYCWWLQKSSKHQLRFSNPQLQQSLDSSLAKVPFSLSTQRHRDTDGRSVIKMHHGCMWKSTAQVIW